MLFFVVVFRYNVINNVVLKKNKSMKTIDNSKSI